MTPANSYRTVIDLLQYRAEYQPDRTAYTFLKNGEEEIASLTYRELNIKAQAHATHLHRIGLTGERALLLFPSGLEFITAFFGCLYAGVIAIPAHPPRNARSLPRIQAIIENANAKAVLSPAANINKIHSLLDDANPGNSLRYVATDRIEENNGTAWEIPLINEKSLAFLQYTSGSTGLPKGVMVSHHNILNNLEMICSAFQINHDDIGVGWLPLFHDMGLIGHVLQPIYAGIPSILMSPAAFLQKPIRWLKAISKYRGTISGGPNFAYDLCLRKISPEERSTIDLSSFRVAFTGAEPVRAQTLDGFSHAFRECGFQRQALLPCYGLAEATLIVSGGPAHDVPMTISVDTGDLEQRRRVTSTTATVSNPRRLVGCGTHSLGEEPKQRAIIVNPESCKRCGPDEIGEIWVAGPHVAMGYWDRPEETRSTFKAYLTDTQEGPFLRTGDLGFIQGSEIIVTGRLKDLIIVHGRNVYPHDIEWTMEQSHPALAQGGGAAFSVEVNNEEQLIVAQELAHRQKADLGEVLGCIRQAIAEMHELPVCQVLLIKPGTIPKTSSGKIQRQATRTKFLTGELQVMSAWRIETETPKLALEASTADQDAEKTVLSTHTYSPLSGTEIQDWLVAHLAKELRIPPSEIDISEPFTYYGLASVEGVAMVGKLEEWLDRSIPLSLVWDYPTVEAVADYLETSSSAQAA